jgi:hypothetical protein
MRAPPAVISREYAVMVMLMPVKPVMTAQPTAAHHVVVSQTALYHLQAHPVQMVNSATVTRPVTALVPVRQELLSIVVMASAVQTTPVMK